jgi:hypothetical protein
MQTSPTSPQRSLRNLYFTRTLFQLAWAGAVLLTASSQPAFAALLLVAYPLWDVACTVYDLNTGRPEGLARTSLLVNALLGVATAVAIALTISTQPGLAIAAFGAWALLAGLLQLCLALYRRSKLGGQWAMILSGAQSTLAGVAFLLGGLRGQLHVSDLGGYAIFGAAYFLISALLLNRKLPVSAPAVHKAA